MTVKDLLIFTVVVSGLFLGVVGVSWYYFVRWYKNEEKMNRKHVESELGEAVKRQDRTD